MAMKVSLSDWGKGLNRDLPPFELPPGFFNDCSNYRFRNGSAERVGGVASVITPSIVPYFMLPYSSGATSYVLYMGLTKAYVHTGAAETEITRRTETTVQTVLSADRATQLVTFTTSVAHGLVNGDTISPTGFVPTEINSALKAVTVTGATTFTTSVPNGVATGLATTIGTYSIVNSAGAGATVNFTGAATDRITGGNFNGVAFVNSPVDGLFYFDQVNTVRLRPFPDTQYLAIFARPFGNFIFQGGQTQSSVLYRHRLSWSAAAEPGTIPISWTPSEINDAGFVDLVSDGKMVDAYEWGENLIVYKEDARFRVRYIGGNDVFDFERISGSHKDDGMLSQNCGANTPRGQVFLTKGKDIRIHQGGESTSIASGRVQAWLAANIATGSQGNSFLTVNPLKNEVWVCFPETGQTLASRALIWNWDDDSWGEITLSNVTAACAGALPSSIATSPRLLISNTTPAIGLTDSGSTYFGGAYTSMLERVGMSFGDGSGFQAVSWSMPRFDASAAGWTASISHGTSKTHDVAPTYGTAVTYTHGTTERVPAPFASGRWPAWKMTSTAAYPITLRSIDFHLTKQGEW
jgi:hypothetical protein